MHDGIQAEKTGLPTATILTDNFRATGESIKQLWSATDYPVIYTAHPTANLAGEARHQRARELAPLVAAILTAGALPSQGG